MLGEVLVVVSEQETDLPRPRRRDVRLMLAKSDFDRYLDILDRADGDERFKAAKSERTARLKELRPRIKIA